MLALFDYDPFRAMLQNPAAGAMDIPLSAELACLAVIDHEHVHSGQQPEQVGFFALDPVVHGVAHDKLRFLYLVEHAQLQLRVDVTEEKKSRRLEGRREFRLEVGENAKSSFQGFPTLEIVRVLTLPAEALAFSTLHSRPVDATAAESLELRVRIVMAYYANHLHRVQNGAGNTEVDGRPSQRISGFAERSENGVQRNATDYEQSHQLHPVRGRDAEESKSVCKNHSCRPGQKKPGLLSCFTFGSAHGPSMVIPAVHHGSELVQIGRNPMRLSLAGGSSGDFREGGQLLQQIRVLRSRQRGQLECASDGIGDPVSGSEDSTQSRVSHLNVEDRVLLGLLASQIHIEHQL